MDDFKKRAVCSNRHVLGEVPWGDLFHYHNEVCPKCGDDKANWSVVTLRFRKEKHWETPEGDLVK